MKTFSLKKIVVIILPSLMLFINSSYAAVNSPNNITNNLIPSSPSGAGAGSGVENLIAGYGSNFLTPPQGSSNSNFYLFTQSPSWADTITTNLFFSNYLQNLEANQLNPANFTTSALNTFLTATYSNSSAMLISAMTQYFPLTTADEVFNFANGQANGTTINAGPNYNGSRRNAPTSSVNSLNLNALIEPIQYGTSNYNNPDNAENFIKYVSNQYNPTPLIDFTKIIANNTLSQALGTGSVQQYLYLVRRMTAGYSVGMSDLYYLYNQRVPQDTTALLGNQFNSVTQSALPANLQKQASPLAIEQWMATHRLTSNDPNTKTPPWINSMENATPATLQRETVYLLAEIRYEMYQQRLLQQRILATLAVQQLQNVNQEKSALKDAESNVCDNPLFSKSNACPPTLDSGN